MQYKPLSLKKITTYPLKSRPSKVDASRFARPVPQGASFKEFFDSLPDILAGENIKAVVGAIAEARRREKPVIWAMGAHVIKCGLTPLLTRLMDAGVVSALALNGAGVIHDFELACSGQTSEDVEAQLKEGRFGMAKETGEELNRAINEGVAQGLGIGGAAGKFISGAAAPFAEYSLLAAAWRRQIPVTVHIAIGTDIIHIHPQADGAALGRGSHHDFRLLSSVVSHMEGGGVFINAGSAVIIPEVFLKAVTLIRNLGRPLKDFITVNLDFISQYRPLQNIVKRPTSSGGRGYSLIGHHELLIPLISAAVLEEVNKA